MRILRNLFSERERKESKYTRELFDKLLIIKIVRLMRHYGVVFHQNMVLLALNKNPPFDSWAHFLDRIHYKMDEVKAVKNEEELINHFLSSKLNHFFDCIEIYGKCLQEGCRFLNSPYNPQPINFRKFHEFQEDFNNLMEENKTPYKIILDKGYKIHKIVNPILEVINIEKAIELIDNDRFTRTNTHFTKALNYLTRGNDEDCLKECNNSLESTLQIVLNKKEGKVIDLYKEFVKKNKVPNIFHDKTELLLNLIKKVQVVRSQTSDVHAKEEDKEKNVKENIEELTELILNLTASFIVYVIKLDKKSS